MQTTSLPIEIESHLAKVSRVATVPLGRPRRPLVTDIEILQFGEQERRRKEFNSPATECAESFLKHLKTIGTVPDVSEIALWATIPSEPSMVRMTVQGEWEIRNDSALAAIGELLEVSVRDALKEIFEKRRETPRSRADNFVDISSRLARQGQVDAALDVIFARVDEMFRQGLFSECDALLRRIPAGDYSTDVLLGLLTATLPAKSCLQARPDFYLRTEAEIQRRGEMEPGLLTGLD
ncbi:MAG: hypothetical protein IAG10_18245 [Planctomycetaceae bacterium]|nr:hypothetical protein [Planctomycetaceae bacterium]